VDIVRGIQTKLGEPKGDTAPDGVLGALVSQATLAQAASLARTGQYAAAESVLKPLTDGKNERPSALDLLARIYAQQGKFSEAEALWRRALEVEPNNETCLAGLKRIAKIRSRSPWLSVLMPMGAALIAILMVLLVGFSVRREMIGLRESVMRDVAQAKPEAPVIVETLPRAPSAPNITIRLGGTVVKTEQDAIVVSFDEGLFSSRATLKPNAATILSELGRQMIPHAARISVRVIGYTDDIPMPHNSTYRDNTSLGMARAATVAEYLRNNAGLPPDLFLLQSAGASGAPYPNDTRENRLRDRTVVIHIRAIEDRHGGTP